MGGVVTKFSRSLSERRLMVSRMRQLEYEEVLNPRVRWLRYFFFSFVALLAAKSYQQREEQTLLAEYKTFIESRGSASSARNAPAS